jgi:hypothetical protein
VPLPRRGPLGLGVGELGVGELGATGVPLAGALEAAPELVPVVLGRVEPDALLA